MALLKRDSKKTTRSPADAPGKPATEKRTVMERCDEICKGGGGAAYQRDQLRALLLEVTSGARA